MRLSKSTKQTGGDKTDSKSNAIPSLIDLIVPNTIRRYRSKYNSTFSFVEFRSPSTVVEGDLGRKIVKL